MTDDDSATTALRTALRARARGGAIQRMCRDHNLSIVSLEAFIYDGARLAPDVLTTIARDIWGDQTLTYEPPPVDKFRRTQRPAIPLYAGPRENYGPNHPDWSKRWQPPAPSPVKERPALSPVATFPKRAGFVD